MQRPFAQLAEQSNDTINHLCRQRRENNRRTPSSLPRAAVLSFTLCIFLSVYLSLPLPSIPAPVSGKALFLSRRNQQPQGKQIKRMREKEKCGKRDGVKLLRDATRQERNCPESIKTSGVQLGPSASSLSLCHQY